METQSPSAPPQNAPKDYVRLPPEREPEGFLSVKFVIFTVVVISIAAVAGLVSSGKISLNQYLPQKPVALPPVIAAIIPKAPTPPPVTLDMTQVKVTSISIGQPSIAIINGTSHAEGDAVDVPGASGWKVKSIQDEAVILENGASTATVPLTTSEIKPLDDSLHPLN